VLFSIWDLRALLPPRTRAKKPRNHYVLEMRGFLSLSTTLDDMLNTLLIAKTRQGVTALKAMRCCRRQIASRYTGHFLLIAVVVVLAAFLFASLLLVVTCTPRVLAYLYGVSEICYGPPPKSQSQAPSPDVALLAECRMFGMPITVPPHDAIGLVLLNPKRLKSVSFGLYDILNDSDQATQWPPKEKIEESQKQHNPGSFLYQCDFKNLSNVDIADIGIPMRFWFGNKGGEENAVKYNAVISPLEAHKSARI
jgi:hypothetical protein